MQTYSPQVHPSQPRVFHYSLDWRFLLPIADPGKFLIVFEDDADFSQTLEQAGIPVSNHLPFPDIQKREKNNTHSFVLPFGLPVRGVDAKQADQIRFFRSIRGLLEPDGYLLVGFNNAWNFRSNVQARYYSSTPRRVAYQLKQAGFKSIKIFGAFPNLSIPEYIFDLDIQAIHFALRHRFRRKRYVLNFLKMMSHTVGVAPISNFLPCYFAVAVI